jgi:hypothetical protein
MEAVLDFGRGCQDLAIILLGEGVLGGRGEGEVEMERRLTAPVITSGWGRGYRGRGVYALVTDCTPHTCSFLSHSSFSYLRPAVEASFDVKRLTSSVADPGCLSRILDPVFYPSRIPDPKTATKDRGEKKFFVKPQISQN